MILTSDNPRNEPPLKIIEDCLKTVSDKTQLKICLDRKEAIKQAIAAARAGDCILIAGKGHETYQIIGEERHHFNDREVAEGFLNLKNPE